MTMRIHGDKIEFPDGTEQFTASSGGGGEAQPPVLFDVWKKENQDIPKHEWTKITFDTVEVDTDSFFSDSKFQPTKEGYYQINFRGRASNTSGQHSSVIGGLYKNGTLHKYGNTNRWVGSADVGINGSSLVHFNGTTDYVELHMFVGHDGTCIIQGGDADYNTYMNGHMVSSFGGISEKEAVVMKARASSEFNVPTKDWKDMPFDTIVDDTDSSFDTSTYTYTPKVEGYYYVTSAVSFNGIVNGGCSSEIRKNDVVLTNGLTDYNVASSDSPTSRCFTSVYMNGTTDSLKVRVYNYGSPVNTSAGLSTYFQAHLITGQSTGGGSGGGTTDILPVLYSGVVNADGTVGQGTGFTSVKTEAGHYTVILDKPVALKSSCAMNILMGNRNGNANVISDTEIRFLTSYNDKANPAPVDAPFTFTVTGTETIAVGGGSGGSYTPEKMVWKKYPKGSNPVTERNKNIEYTNTSNVPRYVMVYMYTDRIATQNYANFFIDGVDMYVVGNNDKVQTLHGQTFIVPAGSTYEIRNTVGDINTNTWHEADMPVAVGTGGKTVAFRGELSANQTITKSTVHKINLSEASVDTDNALVDGKFKPSVAGYYQVSGSVFSASTDTAVQTVSYLYKNGTLITHGNSVRTTDGTVTGVVSSSVIIDVVYLNGTTDYLELHGFIDTAGTPIVDSNKVHTYLSAVLVSGGSASGGESVIDQKWQDFSSTKVCNNDYTNDTGRPIQVYLYGKGSTDENRVRIEVDGLPFNSSGIGTALASVQATVPNGSTYRFIAPNADATTKIYELR